MSERVVHVLVPNGASEAPFADYTVCGLAVTDATLAMWSGDTLRGVHWGKPYRVAGRWCRRCER